MSSAQSEPTTSTASPTLALLAPADSGARKLDVESGTKVHLDDLGPMVVNSDGTLSRIASKFIDHRRNQTSLPTKENIELLLDWTNMTEAERKNTLRVVGTRNQLRLAERKEAEANSSRNI
ncbi:hypothetical protein D9757_003241 [Collybiopsis confluens]|uniref:Uncharacterized protein n=1 Tax=Collybiopsis confluens TaxID=2823264 RepID=A0A8H5MFF0_9AGAR|nr:hypothetical protein D9757_013812 [Collybiopsis confluens]KAF5391972.1 hypothetical protein D9757_003241 [Collybiopsis confluens]